MSTDTTAPACLGKTSVADHAMVDLGRCEHRVSGSIHGYDVKACPDCGVTAHIGPSSFACGRGIKAVAPTEENCLGLKWKAERKATS